MANSSRDCLFLPRPSSAMISSIVNNVSERDNNCDNFLIHWCGFLLESISQALSSFLIQPWEWFVLFHRDVGQMMIMLSKHLLYSFSIKSKTRWVYPQQIGPVNMVLCGFFDIFCHYFYLTKKPIDTDWVLKSALAGPQAISSFSRIVR